MIEKTLKGKPAYWIWLAILGALMAIGWICYFRQYAFGLGMTGMSRDVSWGLYISQFTFLVGVAAGGLMLVLPYYVHNYKEFGRITILGEFLAISALVMCLMFIMADLGQPLRGLNVLFYPTPHSMLFWDMCVLWGYLILNVICGWVILTSERKQVPPPKWVYPFIVISIPFAVSIHTVTAMLYCGLPGRHFWLSAIIAPRFLASAFAAGPSLILIACAVMKRFANFDAGEEAIKKLTTIIMYAVIINTFFSAALVTIIWIDIHHQIIPDVISIPGIFLGFAFSFITPFITWQESLIGLAAGGGFFYAVSYGYFLLRGHEGLGGGDIKLLAMLGAFLGWQSLFFIVFASSLTGSIAGLVAMQSQKKGGLTRIPFGPFLAISGLCYLFFRPQIYQLFEWYMRLLS